MTRILLIDDEPRVSRALDYALADRDFELVAVSDAADLDALSTPQVPDVILLDIALAHQTGWRSAVSCARTRAFATCRCCCSAARPTPRPSGQGSTPERMTSSASLSCPTNCWRGSTRRSADVNADELQLSGIGSSQQRTGRTMGASGSGLPGPGAPCAPINHPEDPLTAVIESFSRDRGASAIFVVDAEDHLLGCIREQALDADLMTLVVPQRLWPAMRDMDTRAVLRAARGPRRTARDRNGWRTFDHAADLADRRSRLDDQD